MKGIPATEIVHVDAKPIANFRTVWIVLNKGSICAVFDNESSARNYAEAARKGLKLAKIKCHIEVVEEKVYRSATERVEGYLREQETSDASH